MAVNPARLFAARCWDFDAARIKCRLEHARRVYIIEIRVPKRHRRQGRARAALERMCLAADEAGLALSLRAVPFEGNLPTVDLIEFYEQLGFCLVEGLEHNGYMRRDPEV